MSVPIKYHNGTEWVTVDAGAIVDDVGNRIVPTDVVNGLASKIDNTEKDASNGVATLDGDKQVLRSQTQYIRDELDRITYDIYNLYQEQYYLGNDTTSPSFGSAKSIFFDPLADTTNYDTTNTTSQLIENGSNSRLICKTSSISSISASSASDEDWGGNVDSYKYVAPEGSFANIFDGSTSVGHGTSSWTSTSDYYSSYGKIYLPSTRMVTGVELYGNMYDASGSLYISDNNGSGIGSVSPNYNGNAWTSTDFNSSNYIFANELYGRASGDSNDTSAQCWFYEARLKVANFSTSVYQSKSVSLDYTPTKMIAYLSYDLNGATSVNPFINWGGSQVNGNVVETRLDPNFSGYTEYKIEFDLSAVSATTGHFGIEMNPDSNGYVSPLIKRYGLYFY